jgi:hypothetical protein
MVFFSNSAHKRPRDVSKSKAPKPYGLVNTSYTSNPVDISENFLKLPSPSYNSPRITARQVDFSKTPLPEYKNCYAVVLENILSASECSELLQLAEQSIVSSQASNKNGDSAAWQPAMVNAGLGREVHAPMVRDCGRIIWDDEEIVARLWDRCLQAPGIKDSLDKIEGNVSLMGKKAVKEGVRWRFTRVNNRMRFLRYGKGNYFKRE